MNKFVEKYKILECPNCFEKYTNLNLQKCNKCNSNLKLVTKYKLKLLTKILVILLLIFFISAIYFYTYNKDLNDCYTALENIQWSQFESIIDKHTITKNIFLKSAYNELYKFMDNEIEAIKNGQNTEKIFKLTGQITWAGMNEQDENKIKEKRALAEAYKTINSANKLINENDYIEAYKELHEFVLKYQNEYENVKQIVLNKMNEIQNTAMNTAISNAEAQYDKQNYGYVQNILSPFLDTNNEKVVDLYNKSSNEEEESKKQKERHDYEIYCYFNLISWNEKLTNDDDAFSKCASKFGISKEEAKLSYDTVNNAGGWYYQDKYPDIFEKYANQYK